jgi:drug/metabolite transporter (DMT)-like permease
MDRYTLSGLLAILIWSTTIALARSLTESVGILTAAAAVYLIGGAICIFRLLWIGNGLKKIRNLSFQYLWGCGFLFVSYMVALYLALGLSADRNQAVEVGLLNYLWPALTLVFSVPLLHKKANFLLLPGTLVALAGVFLVLAQGSSISFASWFWNLRQNPAPYFLGLIAGVTWALYSNLIRRWAGPDGQGAIDLFIPITGLVLLGLRLFFPEESHWTLPAASEALFLGLATLVGYAAWDIAMRKGNIVLVAALSYLTPLFSTLISSFYLAITLGFSLWLGCALIVLGSILSWASIDNRPERETKRDEAPKK